MYWILLLICIFTSYYTVMYSLWLRKHHKGIGAVLFLYVLIIPILTLPIWLYMNR